MSRHIVDINHLPFITIEEDRYYGGYNGKRDQGLYTARIQDSPVDIGADDCLCDAFWQDNEQATGIHKIPNGKGATADKALLDLLVNNHYGPLLIYIPGDTELKPPGEEAFVVVLSQRFVDEFPLSRAFLKEQCPNVYL